LSEQLLEAVAVVVRVQHVIVVQLLVVVEEDE
jgi:hypothetical protein